MSLAVALFACACAHEKATTTSSPAPLPSAPVAARKAADRAHHMQATFFLAVAARDALIAGDMPGAVAAAQALAEHDYGQTLPSSWKHWVAQMQQRASDVTLAPDFAAAGQAVAALALTCGDCHAHVMHGLKRSIEEPLEWKDPPEEMSARMERHEVGVDQLWLGLVYPSEVAWHNGSVSLTRAPLSTVRARGEEIRPELQAELDQIRELARQARTASSLGERGAVYGSLLAHCASCHYVARAAE
jgi:hypothetical protein